MSDPLSIKPLISLLSLGSFFSFKAGQLGGYGCCKQELGVEKITDCSLGLRSNIRDTCNQSESHTAMSERGSLFLKLM